MRLRKKHYVRERVKKLGNRERERESDVLCRTVFRFHDMGELPSAKNLALELRDKVMYSPYVSF
jgi:hypothetical protein